MLAVSEPLPKSPHGLEAALGRNMDWPSMSKGIALSYVPY